MAPVKFGDFSKDASDLLNNDFNFDKKFKVKTKTVNGFEITSEGAMKGSSNAAGGKLTAKIPIGHGITLNKIGVTHSGRFFADASYDNVIKGLSLTTVVEDGAKVPPVGVIGIKYKHNIFGADLKIDAMNGPTLKPSASAQYEKFVVGGDARFNTGLDSKGPGALEDFSVGIAYNDADFTVSAKALKKLSQYEIGVHHSVSKDIQVGAVYAQGKSKTLTLGGMYKLDNATKLQAKVNSLGIASANIHQTVTPNVKMIISTEVNATNLAADSHKFGLHMSLS